tara:strand:+ start:735 stop:890 length:156 start_codon:yes stop_codon:yes gene_type:complete
MNNFKIINWLVWLVLVIIWNYGYPEASPLLDVIIAVILSFVSIILIKFIKK